MTYSCIFISTQHFGNGSHVFDTLLPSDSMEYNILLLYSSIIHAPISKLTLYFVYILFIFKFNFLNNLLDYLALECKLKLL